MRFAEVEVAGLLPETRPRFVVMFGRAAVNQSVRPRQQDPDLTALRDKAALAKLPAEEQKTIADLWADVAATSEQAETKTR
jgi:hypothetical protein